MSSEVYTSQQDSVANGVGGTDPHQLGDVLIKVIKLIKAVCDSNLGLT